MGFPGFWFLILGACGLAAFASRGCRAALLMDVVA